MMLCARQRQLLCTSHTSVQSSILTRSNSIIRLNIVVVGVRPIIIIISLYRMRRRVYSIWHTVCFFFVQSLCSRKNVEHYKISMRRWHALPSGDISVMDDDLGFFTDLKPKTLIR